MGWSSESSCRMGEGGTMMKSRHPRECHVDHGNEYRVSDIASRNPPAGPGQSRRLIDKNRTSISPKPPQDRAAMLTKSSSQSSPRGFVSVALHRIHALLTTLLLYLLSLGPMPRHVGFVMDGNRRYARNKGMRISQGHTDGFQSLRRVSRPDGY